MTIRRPATISGFTHKAVLQAIATGLKMWVTVQFVIYISMYKVSLHNKHFLFSFFFSHSPS